MAPVPTGFVHIPERYIMAKNPSHLSQSFWPNCHSWPGLIDYWLVNGHALTDMVGAGWYWVPGWWVYQVLGAGYWCTGYWAMTHWP